MTLESDRLRLAFALGMMRAKEQALAELPAVVRRKNERAACECGLVTLPGPLARHQRATLHRDLI